jgi:hypothetical protein
MLGLLICGGLARAAPSDKQTPAMDRARKACRSEYVIDACTVLITGSRITPALLAEAYDNRADAFLFHGDPDRAIADETEAIRIDPKGVSPNN